MRQTRQLNERDRKNKKIIVVVVFCVTAKDCHNYNFDEYTKVDALNPQIITIFLCKIIEKLSKDPEASRSRLLHPSQKSNR